MLIGWSIIEVTTSYERAPFKTGADCYVKDVPSYSDGWTSGAWEELLPKNTRELELSIQTDRPNIQKLPVKARLEMLVWIPGRGKVPVNAGEYQWTSNESIKLNLEMPNEYDRSPHVKTVRLQLDSCYTPRNLGVNTDSRRLGVRIEKVLWK